MFASADPGLTDHVERVEFGVLDIEFDGTVLRPRPWTALQSLWAADLAPTVGAGPILELCSGAGQIGLYAAVLSGRGLVQVDSEPSACRFARLNAERAGLGHRVDVRCDTMASALRRDERFPLIVADPPYVPSADVPRFPDDPRTAIDGGPTGLDVILACLDVAAGHLSDDGACLLQVRGLSQVDALGQPAAARALVVDDARTFDADRAVALLRRRGRDGGRR